MYSLSAIPMLFPIGCSLLASQPTCKQASQKSASQMTSCSHRGGAKGTFAAAEAFQYVNSDGHSAQEATIARAI